MRVPDVATFRKLASAGLAGNTPRIWPTIVHFLADKEAVNKFAFISSHTYDHFRMYSVSWAEASGWLTTNGILKHPSRPVSAHIDDLFAIESPDPLWQSARHCFQFDWVPEDRYLIWDVSNLPWGAVKRAGTYRTSEGAAALAVLRHHLGDSFEDLIDLDTRYPGAIIEATYFGAPLGIYRRPLLIWEVRHY